MRLISLATATFLLLNSQVSANQFEEAMVDFVTQNIAPWTTSNEVLTAVVTQNAVTHSYGLGDILEKDRTWRVELDADDQPLILSITQNRASTFLRERKISLGGIVSEIIVTDAIGLNAAVSDPTSDMWQGDEDKFEQTFRVGPNGFHISEIMFDESTQTFQCQISFTLNHPETGASIGAVTVGVNAESFL